MTEQAKGLQDTFLNAVRKSKIPLTVFLVNGVRLQGIITWFDNFCVLLRREGNSQLVYKHAISTILPNEPMNLYTPLEHENVSESVPQGNQNEESNTPPAAGPSA